MTAHSRTRPLAAALAALFLATGLSVATAPSAAADGWGASDSSNKYQGPTYTCTGSGCGTTSNPPAPSGPCPAQMGSVITFTRPLSSVGAVGSGYVKRDGITGVSLPYAVGRYGVNYFRQVQIGWIPAVLDDSNNVLEPRKPNLQCEAAGSAMFAIFTPISLSWREYATCITTVSGTLAGPYDRRDNKTDAWSVLIGDNPNDTVVTEYGKAVTRGVNSGAAHNAALACHNAPKTHAVPLPTDKNRGTAWGRYTGEYRAYGRDITFVYVPNPYGGSWPSPYPTNGYRHGYNVTSTSSERLVNEWNPRFTLNCTGGWVDKTGQPWGDGANNFYQANACAGNLPGGLDVTCRTPANLNPSYSVWSVAEGNYTPVPANNSVVMVRASNTNPTEVTWNVAQGAGVRVTNRAGRTVPILGYSRATLFELSTDIDERSPSLLKNALSDTVRREANKSRSVADNSDMQPYFVLQSDTNRQQELSKVAGQWDLAEVEAGVADTSNLRDGFDVGFLVAASAGRDWQVTPTWVSQARVNLTQQVLDGLTISESTGTFTPVYKSVTAPVTVAATCTAQPTHLRATELNITGR